MRADRWPAHAELAAQRALHRPAFEALAAAGQGIEQVETRGGQTELGQRRAHDAQGAVEGALESEEGLMHGGGQSSTRRAGRARRGANTPPLPG
jgi:hypothetical protein